MAKASRAYGAIAGGAVAARDGRIACRRPGGRSPPRSRRRRAPRHRGPLGHPGADRLPHPHRLSAATAPANSRCGSRARPTRRSRAPAAASSRRCGDPRRRRGRAARRRAAASRRADRRGRHDGRGEVRLRARRGDRVADAARRPRASAGARPVGVATSFLGAHAAAAGIRDDATATSTTSCIPTLRAAAARAWPTPSTASARGSPSRPPQIARVFDAARRARPAREAPRRAALQPRRREAGGRAMARCRPIIWNISTSDGHRRDGRGRHRRRAAARRILLPARDAGCRRSRRCARAGVPMALATDCNPGTSPLTSLLLAMNMAATLFRLTAEECLAGVTRNAARALGLGREGHAGARQARRPRDLGHRAPGRARLPHRLQPARMRVSRRGR